MANKDYPPKVISSETLGCPLCDDFNKTYVRQKKMTLRQWKADYKTNQLPAHIKKEHADK